jgi:hypothetical protein
MIKEAYEAGYGEALRKIATVLPPPAAKVVKTTINLGNRVAKGKVSGTAPQSPLSTPLKPAANMHFSAFRPVGSKK